MLKIAILASGSTGNCAVVSDGQTHILIDAGISAKRITDGLCSLGVNPAELSAIFVTHEHSDHVAGLRVLSKKVRAPICATAPTCAALSALDPGGGMSTLFLAREAGTRLSVGSLWVESFPTPHDAADSVGYVVSGGGERLALCTDLGHVSPEVRQAAAGCDILVCETNHDEQMLKTGPYPYPLKRRILGERGHLSNEAGAELCAWAVESGAKQVILAHLSQHNNTPALAWKAVGCRMQAMGCDPLRDIVLTVAPVYAPRPAWSNEGALC